MEPWFQVVLTIFSSALASSGLWAYLQKKSEQKDVKTEMLIGLAHDRIMYLGMSYIDRGCVTQDEYENLRVYLYEPYERIGGNGSAKRIMQEVDKLPIHKFIEKEEVLYKKQFHEKIMAALSKKNPRWYEAIILVYYMDIPQVKVAEIMEIRKEVLHALLHRAKKWIRKKFGAEYEEMQDKDGRIP